MIEHTLERDGHRRAIVLREGGATIAPEIAQASAAMTSTLWCAQSAPGLLAVRPWAFDIALDESARIARIGTAHALLAFGERYRTGARSAPITTLDWTRIVAEHDAVLITPWLGDALAAHPGRTRWFERWDCAGAAILHPRAIAKLGAPRRTTTERRPEDAARAGGGAS